MRGKGGGWTVSHFLSGYLPGAHWSLKSCSIADLQTGAEATLKTWAAGQPVDPVLSFADELFEGEVDHPAPSFGPESQVKEEKSPPTSHLNARDPAEGMPPSPALGNTI